MVPGSKAKVTCVAHIVNKRKIPARTAEEAGMSLLTAPPPAGIIIKISSNHESSRAHYVLLSSLKNAERHVGKCRRSH